MTIRIDAEPLLALLGDNGEHWTQGQWGDGQQMCLHGAIRRCSPQPGDAHLIEQYARRHGWGPDWNDDTTWEAVKARISTGIEMTDDMLADTYGPQWQEIVAVVRRAATLTADETEQLNAAGPIIHSAARTAAWNTSWAAAQNAGRADAWAAAADAAWDAAGTATWTPAGIAAWDAARALVVRDLIGQHDLTQTHYDFLTRAWATVIGPAHPDDTRRP